MVVVLAAVGVEVPGDRPLRHLGAVHEYHTCGNRFACVGLR